MLDIQNEFLNKIFILFSFIKFEFCIERTDLKMEKTFIVYYENPPLRAIMNIEVNAENESGAIEKAKERLSISVRIKNTEVKQ